MSGDCEFLRVIVVTAEAAEAIALNTLREAQSSYNAIVQVAEAARQAYADCIASSEPGPLPPPTELDMDLDMGEPR